ncbi:hypothetical protein QRD02_00120 [Aequorivita sp. SDUM287046]|uniref:Uncharacterized protein n=1 Tax=Aequorivita aurantiaca TaxID=3053356 RepID=A0ABT8DG07_9FLAO|nr:hypothetical protein [Aequorivita aurantiaca]MDN3722770.1 hypothetical protein [Aequorivita aurantiaca]
MGTDCCPELLGKSPKWGTPPAGNAAATPSIAEHTAFQSEMDALINGLNYLDAINQIDSSYEQLQAELTKIENAVKENSVMEHRYFLSVEEINKDYDGRSKNLNSLETKHLKIKSMISDLSHSAAGEARNYDPGLGALTTIGAIAESATYKKESKTFMDKAKARLKKSKSEILFEFENRGKSFDASLDQATLEQFFEAGTFSENFENLHQISIISGYTVDLKYNDFKQLIPDYNWKNVSPNKWQITGKGIESQTFMRMGKKKLIGEIQQVKVQTNTFSVEAMAEFQQQMWDEIKYYNELLGIKPVYYKYLSRTNSDNPIVSAADSGVMVIWSDKDNKCFALTLMLRRNENTLSLLNSKIERNLRTPVAFSEMDALLREVGK